MGGVTAVSFGGEAMLLWGCFLCCKMHVQTISKDKVKLESFYKHPSACPSLGSGSIPPEPISFEFCSEAAQTPFQSGKFSIDSLILVDSAIRGDDVTLLQVRLAFKSFERKRKGRGGIESAVGMKPISFYFETEGKSSKCPKVDGSVRFEGGDEIEEEEIEEEESEEEESEEEETVRLAPSPTHGDDPPASVDDGVL